MAAYKIISAVIPERVDDSTTDRYLVVAPEDRIVWVTTGKPQDLTPEGRKQAVHDAGVLSLLNKIKREENAVETDSCSAEGFSQGQGLAIVEVFSEADYEDELDEVVLEEYWEEEIH
ncbi:MAG: hypothetical protein C4534_08420 [Gaiellales bacterium]|nr:MAG: hypothetical protein C4534_08420 [Gaiellales bacterium]